MWSWQAKEKRERDKDTSADLGPREEGEMSTVQPGRGQAGSHQLSAAFAASRTGV